tara:strand:+ start:522 stop:806 length:285 start_codon:yes stop_codon:yes gene_type:complete
MKTRILEPTWSGLLNSLLAIIQDGETVQVKNEAIAELRKMAICADKYLALMKDDAAAADDDGDYDHGREMQDEPHQYESDHSVRSYIYGDGKQQ